MSKPKDLTFGLLTEQEVELIEATIVVWDKFMRLPALHPYEQAEFRTLIHHLQRIILSRPYLRAQIKVQREEQI